VVEFHSQFAWVVVIANGLAGSWVFAANWIEPVRHRLMWWAVGVAQVLMMIQVVLGVIAQNVADVEATGFHMFYGFLTTISIAILYSYRQQVEGHLYLLYGLGTLWIMGLGIRAMSLMT
jgi:hypothetical protein